MEQALAASDKSSSSESKVLRSFVVLAGPFAFDFTWDQKSHGCEFCGMHFYSSQALSGHMTIHTKRDISSGTLIKKPLNLNLNLNLGDEDSTRFSLEQLDRNFVSTYTQILSLLSVIIGSFLPHHSSLLHCQQHRLFVQGINNSSDAHLKRPFYASRQTWSDVTTTAIRFFNFLHSKVEEKYTNSRADEPDLSLSLAVGSRSEELARAKRRRMTNQVPQPFFRIADVDLELRLGQPARVKCIN